MGETRLQLCDLHLGTSTAVRVCIVISKGRLLMHIGGCKNRFPKVSLIRITISNRPATQSSSRRFSVWTISMLL